MAARGINRLSAESIQSIDDMRTWAREQEIRTDSKLEQAMAGISELKRIQGEHKKRIERNLKLLVIASGGFGTVLAIVVVLSGIAQVVRSYF